MNYSLPRILLFLIVGFSQLTYSAGRERIEDLPKLVQVNENIFRGGLPTQTGIKELKRMGIKTIINIENKEWRIEQEKTWVEKQNMIYVSKPMDWRTQPDDETVNELLELLKDPDQYPIYLHCVHGEDRTGLIFGLYRVLVDKWSRRNAHNEMVELGFHTEFRELERYFWERTR